MQKPKNDDAKAFWDRIDYLIADDRPYPWAEKVGINRSSFQAARTRGTKPLPKTLKVWAEKIGCSYNWLASGVGDPFPLIAKMNIKKNEDKQTNNNQEAVFEEDTHAYNHTAAQLLSPQDHNEFNLKLSLLEDATQKIIKLDLPVSLQMSLRDLIYAIDTQNTTLVTLTLEHLIKNYKNTG